MPFNLPLRIVDWFKTTNVITDDDIVESSIQFYSVRDELYQPFLIGTLLWDHLYAINNEYHFQSTALPKIKPLNTTSAVIFNWNRIKDILLGMFRIEISDDLLKLIANGDLDIIVDLMNEIYVKFHKSMIRQETVRFPVEKIREKNQSIFSFTPQKFETLRFEDIKTLFDMLIFSYMKAYDCDSPSALEFFCDHPLQLKHWLQNGDESLAFLKLLQQNLTDYYVSLQDQSCNGFLYDFFSSGLCGVSKDIQFVCLESINFMIIHCKAVIEKSKFPYLILALYFDSTEQKVRKLCLITLATWLCQSQECLESIINLIGSHLASEIMFVSVLTELLPYLLENNQFHTLILKTIVPSVVSTFGEIYDSNMSIECRINITQCSLKVLEAVRNDLEEFDSMYIMRLLEMIRGSLIVFCDVKNIPSINHSVRALIDLLIKFEYSQSIYGASFFATLLEILFLLDSLFNVQKENSILNAKLMIYNAFVETSNGQLCSWIIQSLRYIMYKSKILGKAEMYYLYILLKNEQFLSNEEIVLEIFDFFVKFELNPYINHLIALICLNYIHLILVQDRLDEFLQCLMQINFINNSMVIDLFIRILFYSKSSSFAKVQTPKISGSTFLTEESNSMESESDSHISDSISIILTKLRSKSGQPKNDHFDYISNYMKGSINYVPFVILMNLQVNYNVITPYSIFELLEPMDGIVEQGVIVPFFDMLEFRSKRETKPLSLPLKFSSDIYLKGALVEIKNHIKASVITEMYHEDAIDKQRRAEFFLNKAKDTIKNIEKTRMDDLELTETKNLQKIIKEEKIKQNLEKHRKKVALKFNTTKQSRDKYRDILSKPEPLTFDPDDCAVEFQWDGKQSFGKLSDFDNLHVLDKLEEELTEEEITMKSVLKQFEIGCQERELALLHHEDWNRTQPRLDSRRKTSASSADKGKLRMEKALNSEWKEFSRSIVSRQRKRYKAYQKHEEDIEEMKKRQDVEYEKTREIKEQKRQKQHEEVQNMKFESPKEDTIEKTKAKRDSKPINKEWLTDFLKRQDKYIEQDRERRSEVLEQQQKKLEFIKKQETAKDKQRIDDLRKKRKQKAQHMQRALEEMKLMQSAEDESWTSELEIRKAEELSRRRNLSRRINMQREKENVLNTSRSNKQKVESIFEDSFVRLKKSTILKTSVQKSQEIRRNHQDFIKQNVARQKELQLMMVEDRISERLEEQREQQRRKKHLHNIAVKSPRIARPIMTPRSNGRPKKIIEDEKDIELEKIIL
eukprot:TRINITY_DN2993_c0_g1_i1.p1 TRINITY_DN2993_c0_g1~~TRINITY_DN2993_c0_g1_i1.p1  ORF type:complete len:1253 (-),score=358.14 TRINITY_DN2993_c0_g1_i1:141-3899(-)